MYITEGVKKTVRIGFVGEVKYDGNRYCEACGLKISSTHYSDTYNALRYDKGCALWMERRYNIDLL